MQWTVASGSRIGGILYIQKTIEILIFLEV